MNASNSVPEGAVEDQPVSLLGRTRELAVSDLTIAKAIAGAPQTLIVGGDAGIGKTTLAAGVSAQARACGFTVATGHCLDIGADVPLAPLREALQEIVADRTDGTLPAVTRRLTPFLWGHAEGDVVSADALSDLRFSLLELSRETPLMLVLEDMHWADRSTQDAAVMLSRTMKGPMVLLITYRAEDVTRHHPLRRTLAEIARSPGSSRLDLGPLDLPAIAGIVKATTGTDDLELATSILARSGGNPLFAEELAAGADVGVPEHLSALLLARIDALTPDTRAVIRLASVGGARITALLGAAADLPQGALDAPLREALDGNVLSAVATHLQFRHELVREAAYGDLLPDERVRAHLAFANALQARVDGEDSPGIADLSALAYHWSEAGDRTRAFVAHLRAGLMIHRFGAQSLTHLERVLELSSDVPDAEALGGIAKP